MKTTISILTAALFAALITTAHAGDYGVWKAYVSKPITTTKAVDDCCKEAGAQVALVCKDCKTVSDKPGTEKKGIMGWFKADSMHDCSGCSGKITVKAGNVKGGPAGEYKHVCSKCGDNSALICGMHKK